MSRKTLGYDNNNNNLFKFPVYLPAQPNSQHVTGNSSMTAQSKINRKLQKQRKMDQFRLLRLKQELLKYM
jgi:hypothetical protein